MVKVTSKLLRIHMPCTAMRFNSKNRKNKQKSINEIVKMINT
jgi:hypothetical protein